MFEAVFEENSFDQVFYSAINWMQKTKVLYLQGSSISGEVE